MNISRLILDYTHSTEPDAKRINQIPTPKQTETTNVTSQFQWIVNRPNNEEIPRFLFRYYTPMDNQTFLVTLLKECQTLCATRRVFEMKRQRPRILHDLVYLIHSRLEARFNPSKEISRLVRYEVSGLLNFVSSLVVLKKVYRGMLHGILAEHLQSLNLPYKIVSSIPGPPTSTIMYSITQNGDTDNGIYLHCSRPESEGQISNEHFDWSSFDSKKMFPIPRDSVPTRMETIEIDGTRMFDPSSLGRFVESQNINSHQVRPQGGVKSIKFNTMTRPITAGNFLKPLYLPIGKKSLPPRTITIGSSKLFKLTIRNNNSKIIEIVKNVIGDISKDLTKQPQKIVALKPTKIEEIHNFRSINK